MTAAGGVCCSFSCWFASDVSGSLLTLAGTLSLFGVIGGVGQGVCPNGLEGWAVLSGLLCCYDRSHSQPRLHRTFDRVAWSQLHFPHFLSKSKWPHSD